MSHFTVVVIGDDVEEQLEKYDENIEVPPYVDEDDQEQLASEHARAVEYHRSRYLKNEKPPGPPPTKRHLRSWAEKTPEERLFFFNNYWGSGYELDAVGNLIKKSTYNPDSKWDWWTVGGRWDGFFYAKNSGRTSEICIEELDIPSEVDRVTRKVQELFREVDSKTKGLEPVKWEDILNKHREKSSDGKPNMEEARADYGSYPWVGALRALGYMTLDPFADGYEAYLEDMLANIFVPFALVKEGQWFQSGQMGWFGMSTDEMPAQEWQRFVRKTYQELPAGTKLTQVDCHI